MPHSLCSRCLKVVRERPIKYRKQKNVEVWSLLSHKGGAKNLIERCKAGQNINLSRMLGIILAFKFSKLGVDTSGIQAVVPIPAHKSNSMDHAYILAQVISEKLTLPFWPFALAHLQADELQSRDTNLPQKSLGLHERSQVKFRARTSALGGRILLVDDVITTGLTILEAAEALKVPNAIALTITSRDFVL